MFIIQYLILKGNVNNVYDYFLSLSLSLYSFGWVSLVIRSENILSYFNSKLTLFRQGLCKVKHGVFFLIRFVETSTIHFNNVEDNFYALPLSHCQLKVFNFYMISDKIN